MPFLTLDRNKKILLHLAEECEIVFTELETAVEVLAADDGFRDIRSLLPWAHYLRFVFRLGADFVVDEWVLENFYGSFSANELDKESELLGKLIDMTINSTQSVIRRIYFWVDLPIEHGYTETFPEKEILELLLDEHTRDCMMNVDVTLNLPGRLWRAEQPRTRWCHLLRDPSHTNPLLGTQPVVPGLILEKRDAANDFTLVRRRQLPYRAPLNGLIVVYELDHPWELTAWTRP